MKIFVFTYDRFTSIKTSPLLEDENIETSNCLYEIYNTIDAVDRRIDILAGEYLPIQEQTNE